MDQNRLKVLLRKGLNTTRQAWPGLQRAYRWIDRAAEVLRNEAGEDSCTVRQRFAGLTSAIVKATRQRGRYQAALKHFVKVTRSYARDLFHCYDVPELPRTNNDLEHLFGSCRYHERRASGRRRGSEGLVVRGQVRIVAAAGTRAGRGVEQNIAPKNVAAWRGLRHSLEHRQHGRILGRRFRRDPNVYLRRIEASLIKPALPA